MKAKDLAKAAMLLALGTVLHYVVPPLFFGVKPDFLLATMFVGIMLADDFKGALPIIIGAGILTAMTTGFPGGQVPNIVDKMISGTAIFLLFHFALRKNTSIFSLGIIGFWGTVISGVVFLTTALFMVGIPFPLTTGIVAIVLPAATANGVITVFLYRLVALAQKSVSR